MYRPMRIGGYNGITGFLYRGGGGREGHARDATRCEISNRTIRSIGCRRAGIEDREKETEEVFNTSVSCPESFRATCVSERIDQHYHNYIRYL